MGRKTENLAEGGIHFNEVRNGGFLGYIMLHVGFCGTEMKTGKVRQCQGSDEPLGNLWPLSRNRWRGFPQEVDEENWKLLKETWAEPRGES